MISITAVSLKEELRPFLANRSIEMDNHAEKLRSHPYHFFDPSNEFSRPHVLLAGDAAGVDPLCGEGIAFALGYGRVAARHLFRAFQVNDFSVRGYKREILEDPVTRQLLMRYRLARIAYSIRSETILSIGWSIASFFARVFGAPRLQFGSCCNVEVVDFATCLKAVQTLVFFYRAFTVLPFMALHSVKIRSLKGNL